MVVKSLMHSEGQNEEAFFNVGAKFESIALKGCQACLQKNNYCESWIKKEVSSDYMFPKKSNFILFSIA